MALASTLAGCVVASPPTYQDPQKTAPSLDLSRAVPPIDRIIVIHRTPSGSPPAEHVNFSVPVRSEDINDSLYFGFRLDSEISLFSAPRPPSTFDDTSRTIEFPWNPDRAPAPEDGCHQMTLLVSHISDWDFTNQRPDPITALDDSAQATWWLAVNPDPNTQLTLVNCPDPSNEMTR